MFKPCPKYLRLHCINLNITLCSNSFPFPRSWWAECLIVVGVPMSLTARRLRCLPGRRGRMGEVGEAVAMEEGLVEGLSVKAMTEMTCGVEASWCHFPEPGSWRRGDHVVRVLPLSGWEECIVGLSYCPTWSLISGVSGVGGRGRGCRVFLQSVGVVGVRTVLVVSEGAQKGDTGRTPEHGTLRRPSGGATGSSPSSPLSPWCQQRDCTANTRTHSQESSHT